MDVKVEEIDENSENFHVNYIFTYTTIKTRSEFQ